MASAIQNKTHDSMVKALISGTGANGSDSTFLTAVKTYLDANFANFKDSNGYYTQPHVVAAMNAVKNKGT